MRAYNIFIGMLGLLVLTGCKPGQGKAEDTAMAGDSASVIMPLPDGQGEVNGIVSAATLKDEWRQYPIPEVHTGNEAAILNATRSFNRLWATRVCSEGLILVDEPELSEVEKDGDWRRYTQKDSPWTMAVYIDSDTEAEYLQVSSSEDGEDSMEAQLLKRDDESCLYILVWHSAHQQEDIVCTFDCGKGLMKPVLSIVDRFKPSHPDMTAHLELNHFGTDIAIHESFDERYTLGIRHIYEWDGENFAIWQRHFDQQAELYQQTPFARQNVDMPYTKYAIVAVGKTLALWLSDEGEGEQALFNLATREPLFEPTGDKVKVPPVWRSFGAEIAQFD